MRIEIQWKVFIPIVHAVRHNSAVSRNILTKWQPPIWLGYRKAGVLHAAPTPPTVVAQAWFYIKSIVVLLLINTSNTSEIQCFLLYLTKLYIGFKLYWRGFQWFHDWNIHIPPSSDHLLLTTKLPFKVILRKFEVVFWWLDWEWVHFLIKTHENLVKSTNTTATMALNCL